MTPSLRSRDEFRPGQNRAVDFVKATERGAVWVPMGGGKTIVGWTGYADLMRSFDVRRMLVVAPLRVARKVWTDEQKIWSHLHGIETSRIIGALDQRMQALRTPADVHFINRENIPWLEAQFIANRRQYRRWPWDMVWVDEAQSFKNPGGVWHKSLNRLLDPRLTSRVIEATGTPSPNGYWDLYGQIYLLDRGKSLGLTPSAYEDRYFVSERSAEGYPRRRLREGADELIREAIKHLVFSMTTVEQQALPEQNFIRVELPPAARQKYRELERELIAEVKERKLNAANQAVLAGKLLQFANGAVYYDDRGGWVETHTAKIDALVEVLESLPPPVMVAYGFRHDIDRIGAALGKAGMNWQVLDSDESFSRFSRGEIDYGVLHPGSCGHGLNDLYLSGSENILWFGLTNNLEHYQQLNARLTGGFRALGKNITIHHIVADDTRDEDLVPLLRRKDLSQSDLMRAMALLRG